MPRLLLSCACLLGATLPLTADEPAFFFKKGDRVEFLGDSITEQYQYSTYIELYLTTRFPDWNLSFVNAGIGGDTATGGDNRFQTHVLDEKPTALTIDFGMNDGGYGAFNPQSNANYVKHTEAMLQKAKKAGIRVALISPNAVDRREKEGLRTYFETQEKYYAPLKSIAAKGDAVFVDQYAVTRGIIEKLEKNDPKPYKVRPFPDAVHTGEAGGLLMAHTILVGLHAPKVVSSVTLPAGGGNPTAVNCDVSDIKVSDTDVSFTRKDKALPMPVLPGWKPILPYVNELNDLDEYGLSVKGLKAGTYAVTIDGKPVANYSADQLAAGVNLALADKGPLFEQGMKVFQAIQDKNNLLHQRFNNTKRAAPPRLPDWMGDEGKELQAKIDVLVNKEATKRWEMIEGKQTKIYELAQPAAHKFEVKRTGE